MAARDWFEKDFYAVLGVSKDADKAEIKRAYRKLAQKYHPDTNKDDAAAEQRFKEVSEAYAVLGNEEKRSEYDEMRRYAGSGAPFGFQGGGRGERVTVNIGDLFGDPSGGGGFEDLFGFTPRRPSRGQDQETEAYLSFDQAVRGTTLELAGGSKVRIPAGVRDGARIRVAGKGGPGPHGGERGDLYVRVHVEPHPIFRQGERGDLIVRLPVTYTEAALGANVQVPTLEGSVVVKVPPGTRSGRRLRVKGRGVTTPSRQGDLIAVVEVEVPQKLTRKEKELLEAFAAVHKENPRDHFGEHLEGRGEAAS